MAPKLDEKEVNDLINKSSVWLGKATQQLHCTAPIEVTTAKCRCLNKDELVAMVQESYHLVRFLNDKLRLAINTHNSTKTDLIDSQKTVIDLQEKILENNEKKVQLIQDTVTNSVAETVKAEIISYSDVAAKNTAVTGQVFTAENLQKAVKTAVQEEDRCKNLMIFGLTETENEKLNDHKFSEYMSDQLIQIIFLDTVCLFLSCVQCPMRGI